MSDEERFDPADELRRDIESAIEEQHPKEQEPVETPEPAAEPKPAVEGAEAAPDSQRDRDEKGRFIAKDGAEPAAEPAEPAKEAKVEPAAADGAKPDVRPPPGFSVASKEAWGTLPESVRADIAKREQEVDAGFKRYSGLGKFAEEAERNGKTLQSAVADYVAVENELGKDGIGGLEFLCHRLGWNPVEVLKAWLSKYVPAQNGQGQPEPQTQQLAAPAVDPNAIAQHVAQQVAQQLRTERQAETLNSEIAAFGADPKNKFFANLRQDMAKIVQAGKAETIQEAYDAACWLNPEIRAILINEANGGRNKEAATAAQRSSRAAKAVGGAPSPGVSPDTKDKRKNLSLEEEIRANVDAQVGAA